MALRTNRGPVIIVPNLEVKDKIIPAQLTALLIATIFGGQSVLSPQKIIERTENGTFLLIAIGVVIFWGVTIMMLKLGKQYPGETLVEYMPRLWGKVLGGIILWWYVALFLLEFSVIFHGFTNVITLFMFDRTPHAVVALAIFALTVYCALQEFGTILRVTQITLILSVTVWLLMWSTTILNLRIENLMPFIPDNFMVIIKETPEIWAMFSGYEVILLLLPLVYRGTTNLGKSVTVAYLILLIIFEFLFVSIIGVMTVQSAANTPYPPIITMRAVELPGTFIERLENYLILAWIPIVFDTLVMLLYGGALTFTKHYRYADHRPIVLLLTPLLFGISALIQGQTAINMINKISTLIGLGFSFLVIPISLILAWRQKRGVNSATKQG